MEREMRLKKRHIRDMIMNDKEVLRNDALIAFFRRCFCSVQGLI